MVSLCNEKDFGDIGNMYLYLGHACNMRCRHCQQTPLKTDRVKVPSFGETDHKVVSVLENYVAYSLSHVPRHLKRRNFIGFWGGEPLVYWGFIKAVVLYLHDRLDILGNGNFFFTITTNGLLLDEEIVGFCNRYRIRVNLSYDAPYPFAVRDYISDDKCDVFMKLDHRGIYGCYNAYCCDYFLSYCCLRTNFPDCEIIVNHRLLRSFDMPKDIYRFDWDRVRLAVRRLCVGAKAGNPFCVDWVRNRFLKRPNPSLVNGKTLNLDLHGNVLLHRNRPDCIVSNVREPLAVVMHKTDDCFSSRLSSVCGICRHRDICTKSQAWSDVMNRKGFFDSCMDYYFPFYDIVKDEMRCLSYPLTFEEAGWFEGQKKAVAEEVGRFLGEGMRYAKERTRLPKGIGQ